MFIPFAAFAPGIPKKEIEPDLYGLEPGEFVTFLKSLHEAKRSGKHWDIRLGKPDIGLFSWATKKEFPTQPGQSIAVYQQPLHKYDYKNFYGVLPTGYGAGYVHKAEESPIMIRSVQPDKLEFSVDEGGLISRYLLQRKKDSKNTWYLVNTTPNPRLPEKKKYKLISEQSARNLLNHLGSKIVSVQPKIDGALSAIFLKDGKLELFSHRISNVTGRPIVYTEKILGPYNLVNYPPELDGSVLLGEVYAVQKNNGDERILSPAELSGILNSGLHKARDKLEKNNIELRVFVFDAAKMGKGDDIADWTTRPYEKRRAYLASVLKYLPPNFHLPIEATKQQDAYRLLAAISKKRHPLTQEGLIFHPAVGVPYKWKTFDEDNVYVVGISPGEGKYRDRGIGGLLYSNKPGGPPLGVVGTGFSDELREMIYQNPEQYIGRVMRVKYQQKYPTGAYRAPVFVSFEESR